MFGDWRIRSPRNDIARSGRFDWCRLAVPAVDYHVDGPWRKRVFLRPIGEARNAFDLPAAFRGGWTIEEAEAVCG